MGRKIADRWVRARRGRLMPAAIWCRRASTVTFIDPWPEDMSNNEEARLRVDPRHECPEFSVPVRAPAPSPKRSSSPRRGRPTIAFVCMKSYDTAWATNDDPAISGAQGLFRIAAITHE